MIGYHAVPVIADAYMKGIRGYDADEALQAMVGERQLRPVRRHRPVHGAGLRADRRGRRGRLEDARIRLRRLDHRAHGRGDGPQGRRRAVRQARRELAPCVRRGDRLHARAQARWQLPRTLRCRPPAATAATTPKAMPGSTRGTCRRTLPGWPHALGGDEKLVARLDQVFDAKVDPKIFEHMEDITGLIGWYAHGNEPSHHVAYLYAYAGQPWRTQERLGQIMASQYAPRPDGLSGNDDLGQMSAWYVFTALGFYPVAPASNEYIIGRPFLPRATLNLPNGKRFSVIAEDLDDAHPVYRRRHAQRPAARSRLHPARGNHAPAASCASPCRRSPTAQWPATTAPRPYSMTQL